MRGVGHWLLPGEVDTRNWGVGHGEPQAAIRGGRHLCSRGRPLVKPGEVDTRSRGVGHGEPVVLQWAAGAMGRSVTAMGCHCCVVLVGWTFRTHSWVESIRRMKKGTKHMTACHSPHPLPSSHEGTHTPCLNPHPPEEYSYLFPISSTSNNVLDSLVWNNESSVCLGRRAGDADLLVPYGRVLTLTLTLTLILVLMNN